MPNNRFIEERSRSEKIIHEIECGGFTKEELEKIIDACNDGIANA